MFVTLFGLSSHEGRDAPDASSLAEDLVLSMIERCKGCGVDTGDVASLLALELVASLAAYNRAPLPVILAAIAEAAPSRQLRRPLMAPSAHAGAGAVPRSFRRQRLGSYRRVHMSTLAVGWPPRAS
jgi:hypothetical protein